MARVIAIANEKGGAGKSTMAVNLAAEWGRAGKRVLLIDLDPQYNATEMIGSHPDEAPATLAEVLAEDTAVADAIVTDVVGGVDLLAGSKRLADVEHTLVTQRSRELYLRRQIFDSGQIDAGGWDWVVLDCPPNLGDLAINALYVQPEVITPVKMTDRNAWKGAASLLATIDECRVDCPDLAMNLIVPSNVQPDLLLYRSLTAELGKLGPPISKSQIPRRVAFDNAGAIGRPLVLAEPSSEGAIAYRGLAAEISRMGKRATRRAA